MSDLSASPQADGFAEALVYVDGCIERYAERCRAQIPAFVDRHFSFDQTWSLQRPTLWTDLIVAPINSFWAVPYLAAKKTCGMLDSLGVPFAGHVAGLLPWGIKPGYQRRIESLIAEDVLEWSPHADRGGIPHGLLEELSGHPALKGLTSSDNAAARRSLVTILETFSSGRAVVASLAGTALTIALGWFLLGKASLTLEQIANAVARRDARSRAAGRFFLGHKAGSVFYRVFPPNASPLEIGLIFVVLTALITAGALACTVASDPLRKAIGLHQRRLTTLVNDIERELTIAAKKSVRRAFDHAPR